MTTANRYVAVKGISTLERPRYSAGLLLEDDDLTSAVDYTRNMMRLMFRSLFGCGVICGLNVTARLTCNGTRVDVTVGRGVALSCAGDPIEIPKPFTVTWDTKCDPLPEFLWVTVCYRDVCCGPRDISCAPDDDGQKVQTRIRDGFEVRLYSKQPKCACSCEPPAKTNGKKKPHGCCDDEEEEIEQAASPAAPATQSQTMAATAQQQIASDVTLVMGTGTVPREPPRLPELCDCYQDHYDGKCECECCCPCVFVGKVDTTHLSDGKPVDPKSSEPQELGVDRKWIRWIRPVLVGYYKCVKAALTPPPPADVVHS